MQDYQLLLIIRSSLASYMRGVRLKKNIENAGLLASWMLHSNQCVRQYYSEHCNRDVYIITSKITQLNHENFYSKRNLVIENFSS